MRNRNGHEAYKNILNHTGTRGDVNLNPKEIASLQSRLFKINRKEN